MKPKKGQAQRQKKPRTSVPGDDRGDGVMTTKTTTTPVTGSTTGGTQGGYRGEESGKGRGKKPV